MSISYAGHCKLTRGQAQRRIDYLRQRRPDWFGGVFKLTDASDLGRFDREIGLEFGIDPKSTFSLHLLNKDWLDQAPDAIDFIYQVFGTDDLVVTFESDSIHPPRAKYPGVHL